MKDRRRLGAKTLEMMAIADSPGGLTIPQAMQIGAHLSLTAAASALSKLVIKGYLFPVRRWRNTRYFGSVELAAKWSKANPASESDAQGAAWRPGTAIHLHRMTKAVDAPVTIKGHKKAEPTEAERKREPKITIAPTPKFDARFQVDPDVHHFGAGFAAAGISRNVDTGKAW